MHITGTDNPELLQGGVEDDWLEGLGGNDTLVGGGSNDTLDGGAGADSMSGAGYFIVDDPGDIVEGGTGDTVISSISYQLPFFLANLTLTGTGDFSAIGNGWVNVIRGNAGNNLLAGNGGGISGAGVQHDTLMGGLGDDTYESYSGTDGSGLVEVSHDLVFENPGEGQDEVRSDIDYSLSANVEDLRLLGGLDISGTGNAAPNRIWGNDGDNLLDGGAGADTLEGGGGNDHYITDVSGDLLLEDTMGGVDSVTAHASFVLPNHVENLLLSGDGDFSGTGNDLDNAITGTTGANHLQGGLGSDTLDGAAGNDMLAGGEGNDLYVADAAADDIVELAEQGDDEVRASTSYVLPAEVESLVLTGFGDANGTGNDLPNRILGNRGANILTGGAGADTLIGHGGDDAYLVDNAGDVISESILASVTEISPGPAMFGLQGISISGDGRYVPFLGVHSVYVHDRETGFDELVSTGSDGVQLAIDVYVRVIVSPDGSHVVFQNSGGDVYVKDRQTGVLTLALDSGGFPWPWQEEWISADNRYVVSDSESPNLVEGDTNGVSDIFVRDLQTGVMTRASVSAIGVQGNFGSFQPAISADGRYVAFETFSNNLVAGDTNGTQDIYVKDMVTGSITRASTSSIGAQGVFQSLNPAISGDGRYVVFESHATNLVAGDTNGRRDIFVKDLDSGRTTRVSSAMDGSQSAADSSNPAISFDGRYVSYGSTVQNPNGTLTFNTFVRDLHTGELTQIGDGITAVISGDGRNLIGFQNLPGGVQRVVIAANPGADAGGSDSAISGVDYALPSYIEHLTLTGAAISGTGNSLPNLVHGSEQHNALNGDAGDDTLDGGAGNDTLDGGTGTDVLVGGTGNDVYILRPISVAVGKSIGFAWQDLIVDTGNERETIYTDSSFALGLGLDDLVLTGAPLWRPYEGRGNELDNSITTEGGARHRLHGEGGNDTLDGGAGRDTLDGGAGVDSLVGGDGDDVLVWDAADIAIEGGPGNDTLQMVGVDLTVDLTITTNLAGIEIINLGGGNNSLALDLQSVLDLSDSDTLRVDAVGGGNVNLIGSWTAGDAQTIGGISYHSYQQGLAILLLHPDVAL